jgi:hypothetical protein
MDDLDLSDLSDDQVVGLAVALAREAMRRNPALQAAFQQAIIDERARVEAAANGTARVKQAALQRIREQAERAELEVQRERLRRRVQDALAGYLCQAAAITGRPPAELTLVWKRRDFTRGSGPRLQLNAGATGEDASWHLVDFLEASQQLHTSPGLHDKHATLLPWAREACAAIRALGIDRATVIKGIEL